MKAKQIRGLVNLMQFVSDQSLHVAERLGEAGLADLAPDWQEMAVRAATLASKAAPHLDSLRSTSDAPGSDD